MTGKNKSLVGIITARGGSKRIPNKNLQKLLGIPLISYVISEVLKSGVVDRLIVSTDSRKIADAARKYGAEVPFFRPPSLATDESLSLDVVKHALEFFKVEEGNVYDAVMTLQPTSPLVLAEDFEKAWQMFLDKRARVVHSINPVEAHPEWFFSLNSTGQVKPLMDDPEVRRIRSQDLPTYYTLNGAFTIRRCSDVLAEKIDFKNGTYGSVIPLERAVDIEGMDDLKSAEKYLVSIKAGK